MIRSIIEQVAPLLLPMVLAWGAELVRRWLNIQADSEAGKTINLAVERAAGLVYQRAIAGGTNLSDTRAIANLAIVATEDTSHRVAGSMYRLGLDQRDFVGMVTGAFAKSLVSDPTIAGPQSGRKE